MCVEVVSELQAVADTTELGGHDGDRGDRRRRLVELVGYAADVAMFLMWS